MKLSEKTKVLISVFLIMILIFPAQIVFADSSTTVDERRKSIEKKYNIIVKYETKDNGESAITDGILSTLDKSLTPVTASVVQQVSAYYKIKIGNELTFSFKFTSSAQKLDNNLEILGVFYREKALIEIFIPESSKGTFISGDSPISILHEFAHAYFFMFTDKYGEDKMEKEWIALNDGVKYNEGFLAYAYNKVAFMSSYGATSLAEDFAELFSHAFIRYHDGQGFAHRLLNGERKTSLGKKVAFIEEMLPMYFNDTNAAVSNLHRVFSVPVNLYYKDIKLSGEKLQYIGFSSPKYILNGVLSIYGLKRESSVWISDIGGWQAKATDGNYYLIFPGGYCDKITKPIVEQ